MSIEAHNYVMRLKVGNITAKFVLGRLAERADERFSCFPSLELLAAEAEKSKRQIQRSMELLYELRLLSDKPAFRSDGSQTSNRYFLHGPWDDYAGTGKPFPEIVTPKQARAELWKQAAAEAPFREGTAAAIALKADEEEIEASRRRAEQAAARTEASKEALRERGRKAAAAKQAAPSGDPEAPDSGVPAGEEGVTCMSPPPMTSTSPRPVSLMSPLEPSVPSPSSNKAALPRSGGDGRRPSVRSKGPREGGCAASGKDSPAPSKKQPKHSRQELDLVAAVRRYFPQELTVPDIPAVSDAVLKALATGEPDSRTVEQLGARIETRWHTHGWAMKVLEGEEIKSPVGVAINLVRTYGRDDKWGCPNPRCEAGADVDMGTECNVCPERLDARKAARRAPVQHAPAADGEQAPLAPRDAPSTPEPDYYPDDVRGDGEGEPPAWAVPAEESEPVVPAQGGGLDDFAAARAQMRDSRRTNQYAR